MCLGHIIGLMPVTAVDTEGQAGHFCKGISNKRWPVAAFSASHMSPPGMAHRNSFSSGLQEQENLTDLHGNRIHTVGTWYCVGT